MRPGDNATGWLISFLLHVSAALGALLFVQHIKIEPETTSFTWNVAMVAGQPEQSPANEPSPLQSPSSIEPSPVPGAPNIGASPKPRTDRSSVAASPGALHDKAADMSQQAPMVSPAPTPTAPVNLTPAPQLPPPSKEPARETLSGPTAPAAAHSTPNDMMPDEKQHAPASPPRPSVDERVGLSPSASQAVIPPKRSSDAEHPSPIPSLSQDDTTDAAHNDQTAHLHQRSGLQASPDGPQVAAIPPGTQSKAAKADYGWLSELMARWIQDLDKRYPAILRTEGVQGRVTLTAVLHQDGRLSDVRIAKSSGNAMLDQVAVEDVKRGAPIRLSHALEKPQMPVKFSIIYDLKAAQ